MNLILRNIIILIMFLNVGVFGAEGERDFTSVKRFNMKGNLKVIGNTNVWNNSSGNNRNIEYVDVDNGIVKFSPNITFNSSVAVLEDSTIANTTAGKVKWAGLYWTGFLHPSASNSNYKKLNDINNVKNEIENHSVVFYHVGDKHTITSTKTNMILVSHKTGKVTNQGYFYNCFADVTSYMQGKDPRGEYGVANIPSMVDAAVNDYGADGDESGGWSLVVVYENDSVGEKTRNLSVYDGFKKIEGKGTVDINVKGFLTPKTATTIDSTLSAFATGGTWSLNDGIAFTNVDGTKAGQKVELSSSQGTDFFDESITGVPDRDKNLERNQGIDIHTAQLGNATGTATDYNIIGNNQTAANIKLYTTNDVYYPSVVAFATELYVPKFCYDYSVLLNDEMMQKGVAPRSFLPHRSSGVLMSKVFIRNLEGDFPFLNSTLKASWAKKESSSATFAFKKPALVQNPHVYEYVEPEYIDDINGKYYIGIEKDGYKGTIDALESVYAISNFDASNLDSSEIQLNIEVNASISFDKESKSLTHYKYSTSDGTLEVCPGTLTYNPKWYQFNIEKYNASPGDYALSTQVTGTDYTLQIASYKKDGSGEYTQRTAFTGAIEVEPFEIPSFQSLGSYDENKYNFDRICEDSSNRKAWNDGKRRFVTFNNNETVSIGITKDDNKYAMRSAGIRMWVLMADYDGDGVRDDIADLSSFMVSGMTNMFNYIRLYNFDSYYMHENKCNSECMRMFPMPTGFSLPDNEKCYQCLRKYYSQPICSRDNFSVRPYGVELTARTQSVDGTIIDIIQKNDTLALLIPNLISGLLGDYTVLMAPKSANDQANPVGYYFRRVASDAKEVANDLFDTLTEFFGLKFDNSKINDTSKDITKCADSSHKRFDTGTSGWKLENDNVGNYDVVLVDKDWTLVDQARYPYKAPVSAGKDDCTVNSTVLTGGINGVGCDVQSFDVNNDTKFNKIPVKFVPAKVDVSNVAYGSYPNHDPKWAYMNKLDGNPDMNPNMAAQFAGSIEARNAKNEKTSNFTTGCMAQNVNIFNQYTTTQLDDNGNVISANTDNTPLQSGDSINLRYAVRYNDETAFGVGVPLITKSTTDLTDETNQDYESQSSIIKDKFLDTSLGSLVYDLRYNINKLYYVAVNPIKVLFVKLRSQLLNSDGTPAKVWKSGYAPTTDLATLPAGSTFEIRDEKPYYSNLDANGNPMTGVTLSNDIDSKSFKFLYGRVFTPLETRFTKETRESKDVWFSAVVYCGNPALLSTLTGILGNSMTQPITSWYTVKTHSIDVSDGAIKDLTDLNGNAAISPNTNILFDSDAPSASGITQAVNVAYPRPQARPYVARVEVNPEVWLKYHPTKVNGNPEFRISFEDIGYNWAGKGRTGNVINQPASSNAKKRLNW